LIARDVHQNIAKGFTILIARRVYKTDEMVRGVHKIYCKRVPKNYKGFTKLITKELKKLFPKGVHKIDCKKTHKTDCKRVHKIRFAEGAEYLIKSQLH
jgi:hypothetical protein